MACIKLLADAIFYPGKNAQEHFSWAMEGDDAESVSVELWTEFLHNLQRKVPYVPEGQSRVAHLEVEVLICDE